MHVIIINCSPRVRQHSNTDKILQAFVKGLEESGGTYEIYCLSDRKEWDVARNAYLTNEKIIFALPMYVECVPSLMLEFLEHLPTERDAPAELSFILHGGFDEGAQFRLCERFLASLPAQLGCTYGGCLIKGGSFMLRLFTPKEVERTTQPYIAMGRSYDWYGDFFTTEACNFTCIERYTWLLRQLTGLFLRFIVNKKFDQYAQQLGYPNPLSTKIYND